MRILNDCRHASAWLILALALQGVTAHATPRQYSLIGKWTLGGDGGWDYLVLDPGGKRLFVSRGTRLDVIDTANGKIVGSVPGTSGIHGVAIAPALRRGYTSNGKSNSVTIFDLETLQLIREVPVSGKKPDAIFYDAPHEHVFTMNGATNNATVLDALTLAVVATIALPGPPEFVAADHEGHLFVNLDDSQGRIASIDTKTLTVSAIWALPGCESPSGLAIDAVHHRLFSVCDNKVMAVTDAVSGKAVARVAIGSGPDAAIFDADDGLVFSSNGEDGTLTIVRQKDADHYTVEDTVQTQKTARTMAFDPTTRHLYLAAAQMDESRSMPPGARRRPMVPGSFSVLRVAPR